jgi:protein tyrosine/serine phosphatase
MDHVSVRMKGRTQPLSTAALSSSSSSSSSTDPQTPEQQQEQQEEAFMLLTKQLCAERNLSLENIKNARDLASIRNSPVRPGRIFRTGRFSDASPADLELLFGTLGIKTLVDLRSPTELKDDPTLDREEVFGEFTNLIWDERHNGRVIELAPGEPRVKKSKKKDSNGPNDDNQSAVTGKRESLMSHVKELAQGAKRGIQEATHFRRGSMDLLESAAELAAIAKEHDNALVLPAESLCDDEDQMECDENNDECREKRRKRFAKIYPPGKLADDPSRNQRKERHFASIMNELKYVKGTLSKVRKRDLTKVVAMSPGAIFSKNVRQGVKEPFISKINGGGLPMMNELTLKHGAQGIKYVLDLCKDKSRHPIAFYCTAGKDRTGIIAAIMLAAVGANEDDIVEDYSLSANVYAEMDDHQAMVGALSQRSLDPKTFLCAPPKVMKDTLQNIKEKYGGVEGYLDSIGFTSQDREQLRAALLD